MRKLVILIIVLTLLLTTGCSVESKGIVDKEVYSDCPFGNVDCEYPGSCGQYIDTNNNDICDHGE